MGYGNFEKSLKINYSSLALALASSSLVAKKKVNLVTLSSRERV